MRTRRTTDHTPTTSNSRRTISFYNPSPAKHIMEVLRFERCDSFPEGVLMFGCIGDEGASEDPQGHAVLWVVYSTSQPPTVMRMTATEARLVQQRYARQQAELTEVTAKAKRGETVNEATARAIIDRDLFVGINAVVVEA